MGIMSHSSPFRPSQRRTRSHSSPSTSPPPVPRNEQWRQFSKPAQLSQFHASDGLVSPFTMATHSFSIQPPEKWDVDLWRRGKRPRRGPPTSLDSMDLESCEEVIPDTPDSDPAFPIPSSAPSTPHLPSTSDAFQFRSFGKPNHAQQQTPTHSQRLSEPELSHLHSKAFHDLRRTVAESGEGFVQRMREFEEQRSRAGPSHIPVEECEECPTPNPGTFKRGRKRPSAFPSRHEGHWSTRRTQDVDGDEDSDVEILSTSTFDVSTDWSSSKKRAVSLGGLDSLTQGPAAYPALTQIRAGRPRERSSSPLDSCASEDSSEEESDDGVAMQSPSRRAQTSNLPRRQRASTTTSITPPLSFTFSSSTNSSLSSLPLAHSLSANRTAFQNASMITAVSTTSPHRSRRGFKYRSGSTPTPNGTRTERAVAALSLALANGAGSVSDYEALRTAQGALAMNDQDRDAGALWD